MARHAGVSARKHLRLFTIIPGQQNIGCNSAYAESASAPSPDPPPATGERNVRTVSRLIWCARIKYSSSVMLSM